MHFKIFRQEVVGLAFVSEFDVEMLGGNDKKMTSKCQKMS